MIIHIQILFILITYKLYIYTAMLIYINLFGLATLCNVPFKFFFICAINYMYILYTFEQSIKVPKNIQSLKNNLIF
jgi:hypothetical protein